MTPISIFSIILLFSPEILIFSDAKIIKTSFGSLEGAEIFQDSQLFYSFKKIPFAEPPIGELRFQKPRALPKKWEKLLDSKEYGPACPSTYKIHMKYTNDLREKMDENCLHLNIFTSEYCLISKNCSTLVYIHGGDMAGDSAVMFNDTLIFRKFVAKNIVFIIPAFRLGIFSHFTTVSSQNLNSLTSTNLFGYDIIEALKFINSQIFEFGGKNNITLMGHSTGATWIYSFLFSPIFQKITVISRIIKKAISLSPGFEVQNFEENLEKSKKFAKFAGCDYDSETEILKCMRRLSMEKLLEFSVNFPVEMDGFVGILPFFKNDKFDFEDLPPTFPNIPLLLGGGPNEHDIYQNIIINHYDFIRIFGNYSGLLNMNNKEFLDQTFRLDQKKFKFLNHSDDTLMQNFVTRFIAEKYSKKSKIYIFEYGYPKQNDHRHGMSLILGLHVDFEIDENQKKLSEIMIDKITNFIKNGEPGREWTPYSAETGNYFEINYDAQKMISPEMRKGYLGEVHQYWKQLDELGKF